MPKKVLFLQILKSCNNLFSQYLTDLYLFPMCVKYQLNKSLHNFKIYKAHFLGHLVCDLTEQKHPLKYTWMSVKGCKLHYKCIEEIAHFYTKLTAPELTLLLGGTTYMWGKYLGLCCPRGRADFLVVVVDVGAIFFYLQKMMQKSFFQKTNYQAT